MALRAFRSNPGLGGFGGESNTCSSVTEHDCDAFAQIVKELVDNAVDACSSSSGRAGSTEPKRVRVTFETFEDHDEQHASSLLEVTVTDNGSGMKNIQECVEAFRTSKAGGNEDEGKTTGRYGIGLTLCLLHAQRLVPNHYATITSATAKQSHFTKASYVVDTESDQVQCVKREKLPKNALTESGTAVKLLIPGGAVSEQAWPRLAEYFSRFQMSLGLQCSLEVKAPTLATIPLYVKSQQERQLIANFITQDQEKPWNENFAEEGKKSDDDEEEIIPSKKTKDDEKTRREIQIAASAFLRKAVDLKNVAHSQQRITCSTTKGSQYPILEVDIVVFGPNEHSSDDEDDEDSDNGIPPENRTATMALIRMVNRVPLLDSAEAAACGLVQGITARSSTWNSFGLHVTRSSERVRKEVKRQGRTFVPYFTVKDSDHVAPFFERGTHSRFVEDSSERDSDDQSDSSYDQSNDEKNHRKRSRKKQYDLLPAHIRLGNVILLVQINADPSTLPLPTLSKGRLPLNNESIDKALERGITSCLRSLQLTNPTLLLTSQQLKTTVRDHRYIPSVAAALACIACKSKTTALQEVILGAANEWEDDDVEEPSQIMLHVSSLGPALERRLRQICIKSKRIIRPKKTTPSLDKENESDVELSARTQKQTQVNHILTPSGKKSRRDSMDSWGSGMSCEDATSPQIKANRTETCSGAVFVARDEDDDYEDEDWL